MYVSSDIAERIKEVARQRQISVKKILSDTGLGRNTMSNFKTSFPKSDSLAKIADCLDCSVDYLLGRTENPAVQIKASDVNNQLVDLLSQLSPTEQEIISLQIKGLLSAKKSPLPKDSGQE